jgi:F-type H+-transporting ATPase subunit epsilon
MVLLLEIVTPTGVALKKEVKSVVLPALGGEIEILPGHIPLMAIIQPGELVAKSENAQEVFAIDSGFVKISNDTVCVLTDESLNIDGEDLEEIDKAMERAEKALEDARNRREVLDPAEIEKLDAKVKYQMAKNLIKTKH